MMKVFDIGFGQVPSAISLSSFWALIQGTKSKITFKEHHYYVLGCLETLMSLPDWREEHELILQICNRLSFRYEGFLTAWVGVQYYRLMFGTNHPNLRHYSTLTLNPQTIDPQANKSWEKHGDEMNHLAQQFPESRRHATTLFNWRNSVRTAIDSGDRVIIALEKELYLMQSKFAKDNRYETAVGLKRGKLCPFCNEFFLWSGGKGISKSPKTCGNSKCLKAYDRLKPSKQLRHKIPEGWTSMKGRKNCKSCGEQRKVNSERICKPCFSKILSP